MSEHFTDMVSTGELYRASLDELFSQGEIDLSLVAKKGVFCCDVGMGLEIPTFAPFMPNKFVVAEPNDQHSERHEINEALELMATKFPYVTILRESRTEAFTRYAKDTGKFGLVTWLNIFPEKLSYGNTVQFFESADKVLLPGGVAVMSIDRGDDLESFGTSMYTSAYRTLRKLNYRIVDILPPYPTSAGGLFMIGVKPGKIIP